MPATTDIIPDAETRPLDFTALLAARAQVLDLASRLANGDHTAIIEAKRLLDASDEKYRQAADALTAIGAERRAHDALNYLICELGFGELDWRLAIIEGREPDPATELAAVEGAMTS